MDFLKDIPDLISTKPPSGDEFESILTDALKLEGITLSQLSGLLNIKNDIEWEAVYRAANEVKEAVFGNRVAVFAAIYVTNVCQNDCLYCGLRVSNKEVKRKTLTDDELKREIEILKEMGHQRICLVYGDTKGFDVNDVERHIRMAYDASDGPGEINEVGMNIHPLSQKDFTVLAESGMPIYFRVFQETYHAPTYTDVHLAGPKANYEWRLGVFDRAINAGIRNIGLGALFGLYDYKYETLALAAHVKYLEEEYGVKVKSISTPRIRASKNTPFVDSLPAEIGETEIKKIIACLRLFAPNAEIIVTDRESEEFKLAGCGFGATEMCAGNSTSPGGYSRIKDAEWQKESQIFRPAGRSGLKDVVLDLTKRGLLPSFWTSCNKSPDDINSLLEPGETERNLQTSMAVKTLRKYIEITGLSLKEHPEVWDVLEKWKNR